MDKELPEVKEPQRCEIVASCDWKNEEGKEVEVFLEELPV